MENDNNDFDFEKAVKALRAGQPIMGKDGILASWMKNLAEAAP